MWNPGKGIIGKVWKPGKGILIQCDHWEYKLPQPFQNNLSTFFKMYSIPIDPSIPLIIYSFRDMPINIQRKRYRIDQNNIISNAKKIEIMHSSFFTCIFWNTIQSLEELSRELY